MAAAAGQRGESSEVRVEESFRELRALEKVEMGQRRGSKAWVSWWVSDVELRWASDVEDRVEPAAVRQRGESLRE